VANEIVRTTLLGAWTDRRDVTFILPGGALEIRMQHNHMRVIWAVFDMRTAQRNTPVPGEWSINDPVRTFTSENSDGAVMFALTLGSA